MLGSVPFSILRKIALHFVSITISIFVLKSLIALNNVLQIIVDKIYYLSQDPWGLYLDLLIADLKSRISPLTVTGPNRQFDIFIV